MPKKSYDVTSGIVTFEFENEETRTLALDDYSPEIQRQLALHGLSQKGGDSYAGAARAADEEGISVEDYCVAAVERVDQQLRDGNFNAGGGGGVRGGIFAEALAKATGKTLDEALAVINSLPEDKIKEVKKHPAVKNEMLQIRAARAAAAASNSSAPLEL
jgi:hypothetical protein